MKKKFKKIANLLLNKLDLEIIRKYEMNFLLGKYKDLIKEHEELFIECIFKDFPKNKERHNLMINLNGTQISEAIYIIYYLHKSLRLNGDICEFGIANGRTSALLANEIKPTNKKLWLFDSFQGLSKPTKEDILINDMFKLGNMNKYKGQMNYPVSDVLEQLKKISFPKNRIKIVPGFINDVIKNCKKLPKEICFAYVDFDLYKPTLTALNFLNEHLIKKGHIIIDDYNYFSKGVKTAVDEFLKDNINNYDVVLPNKFAGNFCILQKR